MRAIYKTFDVIRLGLRSLTVHAGRSLLTVLGILFGVWSVIAMLAISEGASYEAQQSLRKLGSTNIIVRSVKPESDSSASEQRVLVSRYGLKKKDLACFADNIPGVVDVIAIHKADKQLFYQRKKEIVSLIATGPEFLQVAGATEMSRGRFLCAGDAIIAPGPKTSCVITRTMARRLFAYEEPLGKTIEIGGEPYRVVGVLARVPSVLESLAGDLGKTVIIPMGVVHSRTGTLTITVQEGSWSAEQVEISQAIIKLVDEQAVLDAAKIIQNILEQNHEKLEYEIKVPLELIKQKQKQMALWRFMFVSIAAVSLLVGGIGIMNIMLASVTERTREIGIRRAMGAKRRDIIVQFLVESVTLTTLGGLVGIAMGLAVPWAVEEILDQKTIVTASTLLLPFVMAVAVGLISGVYPAFRAAKLDPITALRHE